MKTRFVTHASINVGETGFARVSFIEALPDGENVEHARVAMTIVDLDRLAMLIAEVKAKIVENKGSVQ